MAVLFELTEVHKPSFSLFNGIFVIHACTGRSFFRPPFGLHQIEKRGGATGLGIKVEGSKIIRNEGGGNPGSGMID